MYSICGQHCFVLCGLVSAAQRNEPEPDSNEEQKFSKPKFNPGVYFILFYFLFFNFLRKDTCLPNHINVTNSWSEEKEVRTGVGKD